MSEQSVYFLAQSLGFLSFAIGLFAFYQKQDIKLKLWMAVLCLVNAMHFLLLNSSSSAFCAIVSMVRNLITIKVRSRWVMMTFMLFSIAGAFSIQRLSEALGVMGICVGTYSLFMLDGIRLRLGLLTGSLLWLGNNIALGSVGGTLLEACSASMNAVTLYRLYSDRKSLEQIRI
ncbi:YgjV family protein [Photobacterium chitinilyticum]|uniref:YgjV family protein n=1 Tax=Photobacterium chitinilyticum TaxID=2485123 RepID=A0A444JS50_9GAMM|nr:YgjV family protein [Photobacterium chitinilyticum]RWX55859.1 YgjV family protein [Photobacterium chitinilyticum]